MEEGTRRKELLDEGLPAGYNRRFKDETLRADVVTLIQGGVSQYRIAEALPGVSTQTIELWQADGELLAYDESGNRITDGLDEEQIILVEFALAMAEAKKKIKKIVAGAEMRLLSGEPKADRSGLTSRHAGTVARMAAKHTEDELDNKRGRTAAGFEAWDNTD